MQNPNIGKRSLDAIRKEIQKQLTLLDSKCIADLIITQNLIIANEEYGESTKNDLIEEFGLEKHGWNKDSKTIKRHSEFDLKI